MRSSVQNESWFPAVPRIAVVGSGAVGCYYGGRLAEAGKEVHFLMRGDLMEVRSNGLRVSSVHGDFHLLPVRAYETTAAIGECDLVIVALKATANARLPELLEPLVGDDTLLLTLQNGLGSDAFLANAYGADRVLGGLCFVCINRTAPGVIAHTAQGMISLGEFVGGAQGRTREVAALFCDAGIDCRVVEDLACERWKKLVWNIPFNGLAIAAGGIDTAAILDDQALEGRVRALMEEVIAAASACGHRLSPNLIDDMIERTRGMAAYRPSSLIDFQEGRAVELEAIWGEPLRQAEAVNAAVPKLRQLYEEIKRALDGQILSS